MMEPTMILRRMEEQLRSDYQIDLCEANTIQLHKALADAVMYGMSDDWRRSRRAHEMVRHIGSSHGRLRHPVQIRPV